MNNIISNFDQIVQQAVARGLPLKKKAILREYLQAKFISHLYAQPEADQLSFVGGTSLRLLRDLPRFSEDLDFDNLGLSDKQVLKLMKEVVEIFALENIELEFRTTQRQYKNYFDFRFPQLLYQLKISSNPKEKLKIKVDYARHWKNQSTQVLLFSEYGFVERVVTNELNQLLVQKLAAYVDRRRTQPRDMFDVVWLYAQGARLDKEFMAANGLPKLVNRAQTKFKKEGVTQAMLKRLEPFLIHANEARKINLLGDVLLKLGS